jgi:hypothetical protein
LYNAGVEYDGRLLMADDNHRKDMITKLTTAIENKREEKIIEHFKDLTVVEHFNTYNIETLRSSNYFR